MDFAFKKKVINYFLDSMATTGFKSEFCADIHIEILFYKVIPFNVR